MVASLSCDTVMVFSDRWFVSKLGSSAMNAVFVGGLAAFASQTFFTGLLGYSTALVGQQLGVGRRSQCVIAAYQALIVAVAAWPLLLSLIPVVDSVFPRLGLPESQIPAQLQYFQLLMLGAGFGLFRSAFAGFFSGLGRTRVVMLASFVSMLTNVPLVWCLVFGKLGLPALGVTGAAIGTLIASGLGVAVLAWAFFAAEGARSLGPLPRFGLDRPLMGDLIRKGTPSGVEFFLNMLAFQTIVVLFQRQGESSATAASIVFAWDMVSFVPLVGIEVGVTSLVGRHKGAGNHAGVRRALRSGLKLGWAFSAVVLAAFLLAPGALVDVFRANSPNATFELARPLAMSMIRIASLYVTIEAVLLVFTGALRGVGDTLFAMIASNGMHWLLVLALWVTFECLRLSTLAGWSVLVAVFSLFPLAFGLRWRTGHWRTMRVTP